MRKRIGRSRYSRVVFGIAAGLLALTEGAMGAEQRPAEKGQIELLGRPCRAKQVLGGIIVRDRKTGGERFALVNMNEVSGAELLLIDLATGKGETFHAPAGAGGWAINEVPGDRLVIGTFYDGTFLIFDLKQKRFVHHVRLAKEEYIWNCALGGDGRLYGGTYPGAKLGALDLTTYAVEDLGAPAPPNLYLRYVFALPDGRILCNYGTEKPTQRIFDPVTKQYTEAPAHLKDMSGVVWNGYFVAGSLACVGKDLHPVSPLPFPTPPADKGGWGVETALTDATTLYLRQGNAIYRYRKGDVALQRIAEIDLRGGRLLAANEKGELFGVRGQDYFVIHPGDKTLTLPPIPTETAPRNLLFLRVDARGRIWSGSPFGQTLCYLDPKTKKSVNTRTVCDAGGEVFDVAFRDGRVYAAAYAGGDIIEYAPDKPWDQWNNRNPRALATVAPGYIRPVGGIQFGPDGKLYSGWMARYGTYGGAVAITEPATGKTDLIENPLGEQTVSGLAVAPRADIGLAYVGTGLSANGLPNKRDDSARFGVLDLKTRKAVFSHTFEGVSEVRSIVFDPASGLVAFVADGRLGLFDPVKRELISLPADIPRVGSHSLAVSGNGRLLYGSANAVIELTLAARTWRQTAEVPEKITNIALSKEGTIYVSCGPAIYRVKGGK